ncbi:unannotated protein [freshwater metagenome]|uniref:Unannotated protein n=1 Tax=freshwater metagenome TaxID=449393 RepID=A0A6J7FF61_9ZZZZ|nr:DUF3866 family protein [Actinomycetota bacterium]
MPIFRPARVREILQERPGLQRLLVEMADGSTARAYVLTALTGECQPDDEVIVNTTAVELQLGTGGWHVVHWNLAAKEFISPGPDHIMKLRYCSLQFDAGTDELSHPECDLPLGGTPVVVCSVHSQVAAVAAAFAQVAPGKSLVYVMTDGASLPLVISDLICDLKARHLISGTVTAGHAFGGDLEAVSVASALGLAVHTLQADAVVVCMGPGVVGTGTALGTTAVEVASVLDTVAALGGTPLLCVRASSGDPRPRHAGISHHTRTIASLSHCEPWVAETPIEASALPGVRAINTGVVVDVVELMESAGLKTTTMGRTVVEDQMFFEAAASAGVLAGQMLVSDER